MNRIEEHALGAQGRYGRLFVLLCLAALALLASPACTTTKPVDDNEPVEKTQPVRPGAEHWQGHALELPANSPVVFWTQSERLLDTITGLRDWVLAEPAMFGPNGEQMFAQSKADWAAVVNGFGMDPLEAESWQELGLDTSREAYVGLYPVADGSGSGFITAFEETLRDEFEFGRQTDLLTALTTVTTLARGDLPRGVHSAVTRAVEGQAPIHGFRAVVPIADRAAFLKNIDELMRGMAYRSAEVEAQGDEEARAFYYDPGGEWPGVMLRVDEDLAIFDAVARQMSRRTTLGGAGDEEAVRDAIKARLDAALAKIDSGRPAAPRSPGSPSIGVAVDQEGAADYAKLRGYRQALLFADTAAVDGRDMIFLENVRYALLSSRNWTVASGKLSGVSYGIFSGQPSDSGKTTDSYFRVNVTLFGAGDQEALAVSDAPIGLGVGSRGLAMSLDMLPMVDASWQSFIGVSDPDKIIENFAAADFDPSFFSLSFPRSLAVLIGNTEKMVEDSFVGALEPLFENRQAFRRIQIASAGVDMRGLRIQPRMVGLVLLDEAASPEQRQKLADGLAHALADTAVALDSSAEDATSDATAKLRQESVPQGELVELPNPEASTPILYYFGEAADAPFMFFSYGLDKAASQSELDALSKRGEREPKTFFARAEPVALFSLLTVFDPTFFEPLDVSILTQRLGALVFSVEPEVIDGVQTIRYDFELERPPSID